ncbi:MAG: disulfide isomerase DsbC N-terminal domain-containing protein [Candidatus Competibacteraceae bacterium]
MTPSARPPFRGCNEVLVGGQVLYLSEDGRFALQGDLLDLSTYDT